MRSTRCRVKFRRFGPYVPTRLAHRPRRRENDGLRARVAKLEGLLEEAWRAGKRQAAPFSRGKPNSAPGRSGRRSGDDHGKHSHRESPGEVDEELDALLTARWGCGGEIEYERSEYQYQDELPEPRPVRRRFRVHIGQCRCCGRRHQGPHPFQTSDALGAAACMLGPRAVALATELNLPASGIRRASTSTAPVCGSDRSRNPRKWRSSGRATADLSWLIFRRMRPSMNLVRLAITRCPACSLLT